MQLEASAESARQNGDISQGADAAQKFAFSYKPAKRLQASCIRRQPMAASKKQRCSNADRSSHGSAVLHHQVALHLGNGGLLHLSRKACD